MVRFARSLFLRRHDPDQVQRVCLTPRPSVSTSRGDRWVRGPPLNGKLSDTLRKINRPCAGLVSSVTFISDPLAFPYENQVYPHVRREPRNRPREHG